MKNNQIKNLKLYSGCLIIVDMINGFVKEGMLHDEEIGKKIDRQIELIKQAKNAGKLIIFIKDSHDKNAAEYERFGNMPHCLKETSESELVDELKPFENDIDTISIKKNSTSFIEAPEFRKLIELMQANNEFDIIGCCSDICVFNGAMGLANYLDQWNRRHIIRIHEDAIATYSENERKKYVDAAKLLGEQQGIQYVKNYNFDKGE